MRGTTSAEKTEARERIDYFRDRFGEPHLLFACHAAFPLSLTDDLLYRLWSHFRRDVHGEELNVPWIAVADVMLANFCVEVVPELFEMETTVREELLRQLQENPRFGRDRIQELSEFLLAYVKRQLDSPDEYLRDFAEAQRWVALAYAHPSQAAREIAEVLAQLPWDAEAEWVRMASLTETLVEPLKHFAPLVSYARGMWHFVRGDRDRAAAELGAIGSGQAGSEIVGVKLKLPSYMLTNMERLRQPYSEGKEISRLIKLARYWQEQGKYSKAEEQLLQCVQLSEELGDRQRFVISLNALAGVRQRQGRYSEAEVILHQCVQLSEELGDRQQLVISLNTLAEVYQQQRRFAESLEILYRSAQLSEELGDRQQLVISLNTLAEACQQQGRFAESLEILYRSVQLSEELGDRQQLVINLNTLAGVLQQQQQYSEAEDILRRSVQLSEELGDRQQLAINLNTLARVLQQQRKYSEAEDILRRSVQLSEELGDRQQLAISLNTLARVLQQQRKYSEAEEILRRSVQLSRNQVFICYSHKDTEWLEDLQKHLKPFIRNRAIATWNDTHIQPGAEWRTEIERALKAAKVAILLVSPNFLVSDFMAEGQLLPLLEASRQQGLTIFWIHIRNIPYKATEIANYQALHSPAQPLNRLRPPERDRAWARICETLMATFDS